MIKSIIVAIELANGIGINNKLPWNVSEDLKHFKALTMGHHIIMGRKTWESIGKSLPGRTSIVISHNAAYDAPEAMVVSSIDQALEIAEKAGESEVFIIGGGKIFFDAIKSVDRIHLTQIYESYRCDTFFPEIVFGDWLEVSRDSFKNESDIEPDYDFITYDRVKHE